MARRGAGTTRSNWREGVSQPLAVGAGLGELVDQGRGRPARFEGTDPYAPRGSLVSLLVREGRTILEIAAQSGHGVDVCEMYYARIFEGYDPARRACSSASARRRARGAARSTSSTTPRNARSASRTRRPPPRALARVAAPAREARGMRPPGPAPPGVRRARGRRVRLALPQEERVAVRRAHRRGTRWRRPCW
jgi:hypothetical protein